jgi:DNA-binding NtrC family response regulator
VRKTNVLLFEHGACAEWAATLMAILTSEAGNALFVLHQRQVVQDSLDSRGVLGSTLDSLSPDLLLLLVAPEAQSDMEAILREVRLRTVDPPVVVVTGVEAPQSICNLFDLGASDFLVPPLRAVEVWPRLCRWLQHHARQASQTARLRNSLGLQQLIGESPVLLEQIRKIPLLANCNATVLITGETGTGKELCARAVHYLSPRSDQPFVALNSGAIPVELVENELFGHESGAFTGADSSQPGALGEADGGTLFLDEIDALPPAAQVKLLRFLQNREYRPLGARSGRRADVRVIAASNAQLEDSLKAHRFREDLYYRLNVLRLHLPPLRERREDIPLLARHFLAHYAAEFGKPPRDFAPPALAKLARHDWPGNVRELENVIERAVALSSHVTIQAVDLDVPVPNESAPVGSFSQLKAKVVADFERSYVATLLARHQGNIAHAARAAQKNRRAFFELMRKHQIRVRQNHRPPDSRVAKVLIGVDEDVHPGA